MALNRRTSVLLEEADHDLLARIAQHQGMATTTLARVFILRGMIAYLDTLREEEAKRLRGTRT